MYSREEPAGMPAEMSRKLDLGGIRGDEWMERLLIWKGLIILTVEVFLKSTSL